MVRFGMMKLYGSCLNSSVEDQKENREPKKVVIVTEATEPSKDEKPRRQEEKEYMPTRTDAVLRYLRKRGAHARTRVTLFLKENGFEHDVNSKKKGRFGFNYTYPLHLAVSQKNVDITNLLLDCGADPTVQDSSGYTAFQLAVLKDPTSKVVDCFVNRHKRKKVLWHL